MESGILEITVALATIFIAIYAYISYLQNYWSSRGVSGPKPTVLFGNFADIFLRRKAMCLKLQEIYDFGEDEPYIGYYAGSIHPVLMIKDPDLIKTVLIKDFNVFSGRGIKVNESVDPLSAHLFNIEGLRWRVLRNKLTPVFTSGKLRNMFILISECADNFELYVKERVRENNVFEIREIAARYTTDVIGSCAFGIDTQALQDENSVFRIYGRMIFQSSPITMVKRLLREISPRLFSFLRLTGIKPEVTKFFVNTMSETVKLRKKENIVRNDFVDMLMQIQKDTTDGFEWSDNLMAAQAFVFFAAGFETSSTTISFALWELSRKPEIQQKLRDEILRYDEENDGKINYERVNDMKYLDMVVKETLRKNPPVITLVRQSTTDYQIPGTKVTLPKGQRVLIPVYSLQRDPNYYPKPEEFDPERFSDEAKQLRHPMAFLPFGDGPKNCIGARFGYYQVKLALIKIIKNFRVKPMTTEPYVIDKNAFILTPVGGIVLKFEPLVV